MTYHFITLSLYHFITLSLYHFITFKIYLLITLSLFQVQQWIFHHPCTIVQCPWSIPSSFYHCPLSMVHSNILPPLTNLHCPFQHPSTIVCGPLHCPMSMIHSSRSFCFEFRKWTENCSHNFLLSTLDCCIRLCNFTILLHHLEHSRTVKNLWHLLNLEFPMISNLEFAMIPIEPSRTFKYL